MTVDTAGLTIAQARARIRDEAREVAYDIDGWLGRLDAHYIDGVPRSRKQRRMSGASDWVRGNGGEHDPLLQLHPSELARLRDNGWIRSTGRPNADEVMDRVEDDRMTDDPWSCWLNETRIVDAANAVSMGRIPGAWSRHCGSFAWWRTVAPVCEADGIDVLAVMTATDDDQPAATGTDDAAIPMSAELVAYIDRLVHAPKREYVTALAAHLTTGTPAPDRPAASWVDKAESKVRYYCTRGTGQ